MRMWAAAAAFALVVAAIILVRTLGSDDEVPVDETTLARSVERVIGDGEPDPEPCRRGRRFQFRCAASGGTLYRVTLRRGGCWEAVRFVPAGGRERLPRRASGCVTEADRLR